MEVHSFDPSELNVEVDELPDSPEPVEILSQHFYVHSKMMDLEIVLQDGKVSIPLTKLVFENEENFK